MQSMEAIISLMVLASICAYMLSGSAEQQGMDDSLYRYQLVNDVWRVLYLRGDFRDLSLGSGDPVKQRLEDDLGRIESLSGLCTYFSGVRATSCPGQKADVRVGSVTRLVFLDGAPANATLMVAKPGS